MDANNEVERTIRDFCKFLDTNGVPWIAAGISELRELAWRKQDSKPLNTEPESNKALEEKLQGTSLHL